MLECETVTDSSYSTLRGTRGDCWTRVSTGLASLLASIALPQCSVWACGQTQGHRDPKKYFALDALTCFDMYISYVHDIHLLHLLMVYLY